MKSSPKLVRHIGSGSICAEEAIATYHSICYSVLRTLVSLGVWFYVCLLGKTWLPSFMSKVCYVFLVFSIYLFIYFISLIADGPVAILPVVTKDLLISPRFTPYEFVSRCKFSTLTTRQPMVEVYFLTYKRFPLRTPE